MYDDEDKPAAVAARAALYAMQAALEVEVDQLRGPGAEVGRDCHGGVRLTASAKRWTYAFSDVPGARLGDDLPVRLVLPFGGGEADGDVVSHRDGELVVGVSRDLGAAIEHATLITDASFLLERLAARLGQVLDDAAELDLDVVARLLGLMAPVSAAGEVSAELAHTLNEEQCDAVALALGSNLTYVWGPPGTGKTTTVAHLVAAHYRAGRSVLVVSNTNTAVDTAIGRIADLLVDEPGFQAGEVLRHRAIVQDELRERHGDRLSAEDVLRRTAAPLVTERLRLDVELGGLSDFDGDSDTDDDKTAKRALRDRIEELDRQLATGEEQLLERARVLASTVYQTWLGGMPERSFDVVVVDEASMVMLPMAVYVGGLAQHSVVVAGDFRQLSSIVTTPDRTARRWLATDAFTEVGIPRQLAEGDPPAHLAALRTQYRMRRPIADLVTALYYDDNPLRTGRADRDVTTGRLLPTEAPLVYVDTGLLGAWAGYQGRGSRFNPLHAVLIAELVEALAPAPDVLGSGDRADSTLGVVTPYAAQERLVAGLLSDRHGRVARGWSSTVHRFQGNEKDAIVLDLADSVGVGPGPGARARGRDDAESRLLNVAVSRARDCLVVVADFAYLRRRTPRGAVVRRLLDLLESEGQPMGVELSADGLGRLQWPGEHLRSMPIPHLLALHSSAAMVPALTADIDRALDEVVIWTPRVSSHGMASWSAALRRALARGVAVRVVTRTPDQQPLGELVIRQMRDAGVVIDLWEGMDERLALVDSTYVWHGDGDLGLPVPDGPVWVRARSTALGTALVSLLRPATGPRRRLGEATNAPCRSCAAPSALRRTAGAETFVCTGSCPRE
ncbi:MAG TPA: AAA domain-containing protein [Mycobacteriales bacterium]|nr:AAA domain-containing protein [Mycobacteriales bacterium]